MSFNFIQRQMGKNSTSNFIAKLQSYSNEGWIPQKFQQILGDFYDSYKLSLESCGSSINDHDHLFCTFLDLIKEQFSTPHSFQPYHQQVREPFDYYLFGNEFLRPLVDAKTSSVKGLQYADEIVAHLNAGHNVILLANHQIEGDPQAISILLDKDYPKFAAEMIFVAGERVITDPLAIPFSMGRNLLCIYSKRYIDIPPEQKLKKQMHNKRTMELMSALLSEGSKCIYVAPSGGRDRPNAQGIVEVAPFDPQSIEMFYLMSQKSSHPTFFYPLALKTYELLPPPQTVQIELGETRKAKVADIHLSFGPRIDMALFPGSDNSDKHARRKARADYIWQQVKKDYEHFKRVDI